MNAKIEKFREGISSLTQAIASEIVSIMLRHPGQTASFVELSSSPILLDNAEEDRIVTLDSVDYDIDKECLILYGSNSWGEDYSLTVSDNSRQDPYLLTEVLECLLEYESLLFCSPDDEDDL